MIEKIERDPATKQRFLINYYEDAKDHEHGKHYKGQWRFINNKMVKDGVGVMCWPDGSKYVGHFANDKMCGSGRMTQQTGDNYTGEWKDNMANGHGVFVDAKGCTYDGDWVDDLQHGYGRETWNEGKITFSGEYVRGKKNGKGRYEWEDGSYYQGDFVDSMFEGYGKLDNITNIYRCLLLRRV